MARFLAVFRPREPLGPGQLIEGLEPLMEQLEAAIDHRTPAHLSAMLRSGDTPDLQLFADEQARADGRVLEVVLISGESMGRGAPQTRGCFENLLHRSAATLPSLELVFRSDRDGPIPTGRG
ncbi:MAG: hypothetical protein VKI81_05010 [Synechococcaceae cyanobacterium]|nr:hypothetical protein [Synechococcaceae cyanobacterium]